MRKAFTTSKFDKRLVVFVKSHPELSKRMQEIIDKVVKNPFDKSLRTHKLSGRLQGCLASSITYQYRIAFLLMGEKITFLDIGSHDEVY